MVTARIIGGSIVTQRRAWLVVLAIVLGASRPGSAAPDSARIVVLESHVGPRSNEAARALAPVLEELEVRGFAARAGSVARYLGGRAPRPGIIDEGKSTGELVQAVELGFDAFVRGRFAEAETRLSDALAMIHRNPALIVLDTNNVTVTYKALVGLALSQARLGETTKSTATMTELIRTFRTQPLPRAEYGPQAEQFYRTVYKELQAAGRGRLSVTAGTAQAVIFVDGQIRGVGKAELADLFPGFYRVFVQVPGAMGRWYEIEVKANEDSELDVQWEVDSTLWVGDAERAAGARTVPTGSWIGFQFATDAERAKEAAYAGALARRWSGGAGSVAVVGTMQVQGKPAVIGTVYVAGGKVVRSATVVIDGNDATKLRSLARFLADGTESDGVTVVKASTASRPRVAAPDAPRAASSGSRLAPKLVVGLGAAAIVTGAALVAVDQDLDPLGQQQPTYRPTAAAGVAIGAIGVAAVGAGIWWWVRGNRSSVPAVAVTSSTASIGWVGRF